MKTEPLPLTPADWQAHDNPITAAMRRAVGDNPAKPDERPENGRFTNDLLDYVVELEAALAALVGDQYCSGLSRGSRCARVKCAACDARALLEGCAQMNQPDQNPAKASVATARDAVAMERHGCRYAGLRPFLRGVIDAEVKHRMAPKPAKEETR